MFFEYPGDVKGTGFLTWDYDEPGKDDDKWLYLPAMKKTRRISGSSARQDYFMGSDFTYDDMGSRSVDEDTHELLGRKSSMGTSAGNWSLFQKTSAIFFQKDSPDTSGLPDTGQGGVLRQAGQAAPPPRNVRYRQGGRFLGRPEDAHEQRADGASDDS